MKKLITLTVSSLVLIANLCTADIISVNETNLGGDAPATTANNAFAEDLANFSDRQHQHNGAAFDGVTELLSTSGTTIVPLPGYLLGGDVVRFANNARDNAGYSADITVDAESDFYLLIDNRMNGPGGSNNSSNSSDPVLGGSLQWVLDDGWARVNTGISPNGQADYTAIDELDGAGLGVGAGNSLNQFYAVYRAPNPGLSVTLQNQAITGNMYSFVAVETIPEPGTLGLFLLGLVGLGAAKRRFHA